MSKHSTPYETITFYLLAACTVLLDQLTKFAVVTALAFGNSRPLIDGLFNLTYVRNTGAAFSMLGGHTGKLGLVALLVACGLAVYQWRTRPRELTMVIALGLYLGGALGNFIDRVTLGYVRDMFDLRWGGQNVFPIFNVADIAVCTAAGLFLLHTWLQSRRPADPALVDESAA